MKLDQPTIEAAAKRLGIQITDLNALLAKGHVVTYQAGDCLYHESTPRLWLGIILEGEVEIIRGAQARSVTLAMLIPGALISEGVMLDDLHAHGAYVVMINFPNLHRHRALARALAFGPKAGVAAIGRNVPAYRP